MATPLLEFTNRGIYCAQGMFYIDPSLPVDDGVITHAHSDHARMGNKRYLAHHLSEQVLRYPRILCAGIPISQWKTLIP